MNKSPMVIVVHPNLASSYFTGAACTGDIRKLSNRVDEGHQIYVDGPLCLSATELDPEALSKFKPNQWQFHSLNPQLLITPLSSAVITGKPYREYFTAA